MENTESRRPVQYRAKEKSLIGNDIVEAGEVVEYAGLPSENLEPLCDEGRARAAEFEASNKKRVDNLVEKNPESAVGDPAKFLESFTKLLADQKAEADKQKAEADAKFAELAAQNNQLLQLLLQDRTAPAAPVVEKEAVAPVVADEKPADSTTGEQSGTSTETTEDKPVKRTKG